MELKPLQQQTLKLHMTTELRQAISILQYSTQELIQYLRDMTLENPLIDFQEPEFIGTAHLYDSFSVKGRKGNPKTPADPMSFIEAKPASLQEELMDQARWSSTDDRTFQTLAYLILQLDEDGYFREDLETTATQLNRSLDEVDAALRHVQTFEPAGIGARNLKECLLLQIDRRHPENWVAQALVRDHLNGVAEQKWAYLARELSISEEEIQRAAGLIRTLNPKPADAFAKESTAFITPDLFVEKAGYDYTIGVFDHSLPTIRLNHEYDSLLASPPQGDLSKYLYQKYKQVNWLIKSIEQRRETLIKVATTIMRKQRSFLTNGTMFLAPLTLREVADDVGVHESTVSRAIREKYIQTPQGVFELKTFFSSKVKTEGLSELSSTSVKLLIKEMIKQEDKHHPFSDQKISETLKTAKGIRLSRRAVAKYRLELNIPSSNKRKL
ncbi:RNA polymerase factor sigma-54 [Camelliibacillus cellulosilyticus]|uniref:RNA polymerase factor sigma-54 n=1 Tax=Camelliibacillus cellulosilyticus TaxID=2174486 RepID=A0ABV9GMZ3_9BACL